MLTDGQIIPITNLLDEDGDETGDLNEARAFVAGPDSSGKWHTDSIESYGNNPSAIN